MGIVVRRRKLAGRKVGLFLDMSKGTEGSKRVRENLGLVLVGDRFHDKETLRMAQLIRANRERELLQEEHGLTDLRKRKGSFVEYCDKLRESKNAENTRLSWEHGLAHLKEYVGGEVTFAQLTSEKLEGFKKYLLGKVSANSADLYFAHVKSALSQAVKDGIITSNPGAYISIRKEKRHPVFLTLEEIRKLSRTEWRDENVKNAFLFSCCSGLRYSDVASLSWDEVEGEYIVFSQRKTGEAERMPLSESALKILHRQKEMGGGKGLVFALPRHSTVDRQIKEWVKLAEIGKRISFHKARHSFACLALSRGVDIYTMSKLLGHKNLQTTQIYAQVIDEKKKQAVSLLPTI